MPPPPCPYRQAYHEDRQAALCGLLVFVPGEIMKPIPFNMKGTEYALTLQSYHLSGRQSYHQALSGKLRPVGILGQPHGQSGRCVPRIVDISTPSPLANAFTPGSSAMAGGTHRTGSIGGRRRICGIPLQCQKTKKTGPRGLHLLRAALEGRTRPAI